MKELDLETYKLFTEECYDLATLRRMFKKCINDIEIYIAQQENNS